MVLWKRPLLRSDEAGLFYALPPDEDKYTTEPTRLKVRVDKGQERSLNEICSRIFRGSMPELYADPNVGWETY